jgi:hypothetical protein
LSKLICDTTYSMARNHRTSSPLLTLAIRSAKIQPRRMIWCLRRQRFLGSPGFCIWWNSSDTREWERPESCSPLSDNRLPENYKEFTSEEFKSFISWNMKTRCKITIAGLSWSPKRKLENSSLPDPKLLTHGSRSIIENQEFSNPDQILLCFQIFPSTRK